MPARKGRSRPNTTSASVLAPTANRVIKRRPRIRYPPRSHIEGLPNEVTERIAIFLPTAPDIFNFQRSCRHTWQATSADTSDTWRAVFETKYDTPPTPNNSLLKRTFIDRKRVLQQTNFRAGATLQERSCLKVLKDLIFESFLNAERDDNGDPISKNMAVLDDFLRRSNFLEQFMHYAHQLRLPTFVMAIHACLAHFLLDASMGGQVWDFQISQSVVYSHPKTTKLFTGVTSDVVNMQYVCHIINFFRYHIKGSDETTFQDVFAELAADRKPRAWDRCPRPEQIRIKGLDRQWKGCYAFLPNAADMTRIRRLDLSQAPNQIFLDDMDTDNGVENIDFDFSLIGNQDPFPGLFDAYLDAKPTVRTCAAREKDFIKEQNRRNRETTYPPPPNPYPLHSRPWIREESRRLHPDTPDTPGVSSPRHDIDYLPFTGMVSHYSSDHKLRGIMHGLPDQDGVPSFQRISMMKQLHLRIGDDDDAASGINNVAPTASSASNSTAAQSNSSTGYEYFANIFANGSNNAATAAAIAGPTTPATTTTASSSAPSVFNLPQPPDNDDNADEELVIDEDTWCYEGVVLPGAKIIVGRWWAPLDDLTVDSSGEGNDDGYFGFADDEYTRLRSQVSMGDARTMLATGPFLMWSVQGTGE